ncbi:hypothetical protein [Streptomyces laurentii]|uniref:hypothetical protein n=1 Tax=Streptomyces laurentii TaxID=39478 RepID=UPI0033D0CDF1
MISGNGQTCPGCGRDDLTQAVPAAYLAGRTAVTSRERDMDGDSRTVTRRETTALSAALAPVPKGPTYALGCLGALAGVVAVVLVRRRNAFARLTRGRQRAEALWARGWYCHRCGTAHFADVPGEDVRPLTLQEFRERVWEAGGYGDLAAQRRAID